MAAMSTPHWQKAFLEVLTTSCNVAHSARAVGVSSSTVYSRRDADADFAAAWDIALEDAYDLLESEARRRAFAGVEEPVVYQGQMTPVFERESDGTIKVDDDGRPVIERHADGSMKYLTVRKYSDGLAQFLLKGYRRKKFGDKQEITGADGGALQLVDETKKAARIASLLALAAARKAKGSEPEDLSDLA
jgi:hypothetical protein